MRFYKIESDETVIDYLLRAISRRLSGGERVLWLLSGGSAIRIEVAVAQALRPDELSNLDVSLFDERFGAPGHPDSNWQQLADAGFELPGANLQPVLAGKDMSATLQDFSAYIDEALTQADYAIGLAGIGPDGHTLGIKPGSPAVDAKEPAIAYEWPDYARLTTTSSVIARMNEIVVYAMGHEKQAQLQKLQGEENPNEQPAQLLKLCPEVKIFSDQTVSSS